MSGLIRSCVGSISWGNTTTALHLICASTVVLLLYYSWTDADCRQCCVHQTLSYSLVLYYSVPTSEQLFYRSSSITEL